jgi:predicted amino acid-binding ACT domain protein
MIRKNNCPEESEPEFIMVSFDEKGRPVGAKPVNNPSVSDEQKSNQNNSYIQPSTLVVNKEVIRKLLFFVLGNTENLRQEIRQSNSQFQQLIEDIKITNQNQNGSFYSLVEPLDYKIENLGKWASLQNEFNQTIKQKLDALNVYLGDLSEKMSQRKDLIQIGEKLEDMSLRISNLTEEIAGTKIHEMETVEKFKSLSKEISALGKEIQYHRLVESEFEKKFNLIGIELKEINKSILQNNIQNRQIVSGIDEKLNEFSRIRDELSKNQRQMKVELMINQEKISETVSNEVLSKIKKMLKKPKRRLKRPQKARVIRFLKKNFEIEPLSKVLVLTDKRNYTFGQTLHESVRKLSEKSVFIVTENKTNGTPLEKSILEAVKQSDYVFVVGTHSITELKEISERLKNKVKIISIKRSLKCRIL